MKKNDLNNIFVKTKIKTTNGNSIIIPNTAQNLYLNDEKKQHIKLKSIPQETYNQTNNDSEESESDSTESDSDELETDENNDKKEDIVEEINIDQSDNDTASNIESESESESISDSESVNETETEIERSEAVETEYNDDKDSYVKNEDDDECIFEYDDIIDDKDSDNKIYQIPQNERITDKQLTYYEKIRVLGIRAKQIAMGAKVMVKYDTNMSSVELAKHELNNKTMPLMIKRPLPNNTFEIWKISELTINDIDSKILIDDLNKSYKMSYDLNM